jgi:hypothetical protein
LGASFLKNVYSVYDYRSFVIGFAQPSNVYNTLSNITLLPNLSNQPQGQGNNTNGTQTGGDGSNGGNTSAASTHTGVSAFLFVCPLIVEMDMEWRGVDGVKKSENDVF